MILMKAPFTTLVVFTLLTANSYSQEAPTPYKIPPDDSRTAWASPENPTAAVGTAARENGGAKGHAFIPIPPNATVTLLNMEGAGIVHRIWLTLSDRNPETLKSLRIEMYWDHAPDPAVAVPLSEFFGAAFGKAKTLRIPAKPGHLSG